MSDQVREAEERLRRELAFEIPAATGELTAGIRPAMVQHQADIRTVLDALSELRAERDRLRDQRFAVWMQVEGWQHDAESARNLSDRFRVIDDILNPAARASEGGAE